MKTPILDGIVDSDTTPKENPWGIIAGVEGGSTLLSKAKPLFTGRTNLYHGTTEEYAKKILEEGLKPSASGGSKGVSSILVDIPEAPTKIYLTKKRLSAAEFAAQTIGTDKYQKTGLGYTDALLKIREDPAFIRDVYKRAITGKGIVRANVPLWAEEFASKIVRNPETPLSFKEYYEKNPAPWYVIGNAEKFQHKMEQKQRYNTMSKSIVLDTVLPPEYIKGSDKFKKLTLEEIIRYAKTKPGRFAAGTGLGVAGLGGLTYGIHSWLDRQRKKEVPE